MKPIFLMLALLLSPTWAAAELAWRDRTPVPEGPCPMKHLEPYFWDFLENADPAVHQPDWEALDTKGRAQIIVKHCAEAARAHEVFVEVKVRLDYALRMARGSEHITSSEKLALIDQALSETKGSAGMVEERLGPDATVVMVMKDTRRVLQIERANLVARRGSDRMEEIQAKGSLQGARAVQVNGRVSDQKAAGDQLFDSNGRRPFLNRPVDYRGPQHTLEHTPDDPAMNVGGQRQVAAGSLRPSSSKYEAAATKEIPRPADPDSATGKAFKSIRNAFGNGDPVEKAPPPAPKKAERIEGYSAGESKFIQDRKEDAWFGFGWLAERRAKMDVDSVRSSMKNCAERPNFCAKIEQECRDNPELQGSCLTIRNREKIHGR